MGRSTTSRGAIDILDGTPPRSFEFFAGRSSGQYEYCGRYVMEPFDAEEHWLEDPHSFSEDRVSRLLRPLEGPAPPNRT